MRYVVAGRTRIRASSVKFCERRLLLRGTHTRIMLEFLARLLGGRCESRESLLYPIERPQKATHKALLLLRIYILQCSLTSSQ